MLESLKVFFTISLFDTSPVLPFVLSPLLELSSFELSDDSPFESSEEFPLSLVVSFEISLKSQLVTTAEPRINGIKSINLLALINLLLLH